MRSAVNEIGRKAVDLLWSAEYYFWGFVGWAVPLAVVLPLLLSVLSCLVIPGEGTVASVDCVGSSSGDRAMVVLEGGEVYCLKDGLAAPSEGMDVTYWANPFGNGIVSWEEIYDPAMS